MLVGALERIRDEGNCPPGPRRGGAMGQQVVACGRCPACIAAAALERIRALKASPSPTERAAETPDAEVENPMSVEPPTLLNRWLVVIFREQEPTVTPFSDEETARDFFARASWNWSDSFLCRIVIGPTDSSEGEAAPTETPPLPQRDAAPPDGIAGWAELIVGKPTSPPPSTGTACDGSGLGEMRKLPGSERRERPPCPGCPSCRPETSSK